jgi:hypothetical protein
MMVRHRSLNKKNCPECEKLAKQNIKLQMDLSMLSEVNIELAQQWHSSKNTGALPIIIESTSPR